MILPKAFFTIICDNCGADAFDGDEVSAWNTAEFAWDTAEEIGWAEYEGKHYCPVCFRYDDEGGVEIQDNQK